MLELIVHISVAGLTIAMANGASCPVGWRTADGYCYSFYGGTALSWDDAESTCVKDGGHLVVESSAAEHAAFVNYRSTLQKKSDPVWVGIHAEITDTAWAWLSDQSNVGDTFYENWVNNKNRPLPILGLCAMTSNYNSTERWQSYNCSSNLPFICEVSPSKGSGLPSCPANYTSLGNYCYSLTTGIELPWEQAKNYCINAGSRLLLESSSEEHDALLQYRQKMPSQIDAVWIGIYVRQKTYWTWTGGSSKDRTNLTYENWQNGTRPAAVVGQCVATVQTNNLQVWQTLNCSLGLSFICEITPLNTSASTDNSTLITADNSHDWKKVYQNSTFQLPNQVVDADKVFTSTVVSCAVACTSMNGCKAFNYQREDNTCQFILVQVTAPYVSQVAGWDVWTEVNSVV